MAWVKKTEVKDGFGNTVKDGNGNPVYSGGYDTSTYVGYQDSSPAPTTTNTPTPAPTTTTPTPAPTTPATTPVPTPTTAQTTGSTKPVAPTAPYTEATYTYAPSEPTQPTAPSGITSVDTTTGTYRVPSQTAGLSAIPTGFAVATNTAGFTPEQLSGSLPGTNSNNVVEQVPYTNEFGSTIMITEIDGEPKTYVPPGYSRSITLAKGGVVPQGYADGGDVASKALFAVAKINGYQGTEDSRAVRAFMNSSEGLRAKARAVGVAMNKGGYVLRAAEGTDVVPFSSELAGQTKQLINQTMSPVQAPVAMIQPNAADFIPTSAGQAAPIAPFAQAATVPTTAQALIPGFTPTATMDAATAAPQVQAVTDVTQAAQGQVGQQAQVQAAQQGQSAVSNLQEAQGTAIMMNNPVQRQIQAGELVSGSANAQTAAQFTEQVQAAQATPSTQATVQGQLDSLMQDFQGGATPAWAAGAMRNAAAQMAARGLGASSMAGQAIIQAAMESALPIAQADAATMASFEAQNLSNRQQRAMLAAQQRAEFLGMEFTQDFQAKVANASKVSDVANMNFTAEQQIALENSRAANTMNMANLSNSQAMVMAEAAALAQLDMSNLNNRQQAAVQNAQSFLQMDMANLSNEQQTALFKSQQNIQSLFTDQAAENAARQFNASSENQTNQFFSNLVSQTAQFNASQQNAMDQFNVNSVNAMREFNSNLQNQRDMFNAQNGLVVAQANAQWRQTIATANTAAQNESNMNFAKTINALTSTNLDAYWQRERDIMSFAFTSAENAADRMSAVLLEKMSAENKAALADEMGKGALTATLLKGGLNYITGNGFWN